MSIYEIKNALFSDIQDLINKRELLLNGAKATEEYQAKRKQFHQLQHQLEQLNLEIETIKNQKDDNLLVKQISEHSQHVIHSLNAKLVNISQILTASEKHSIESFTALFHTNLSMLAFKDKALTIPLKLYEPEDILLKMEQQQQALLIQVQDSEQEFKQLEQLICDANNPELNQAKVLKLLNDIQKNEADIALLDAFDINTEHAKKYTQEITALIEKKNILDEQLRIHTIQFDDFLAQQGRCQSILDQLSDQQEKFKKITDFLGHASHMYEVLPTSALQQQDLQPKTTVVHELFDQAHDLSELAKKLQKQYNDFIVKFSQFSNAVPSADIDLNRVHIRLNELEQSLEIYHSMFSNLDLEQQQFRHAVLGHNEEIRSQVQEINEAQDQLHRAVAMINKKINHHQISNLTEIRLQLETVSDFDHLKNTLEKHNISGETLAEESFYLSLIAFFNKHQDRGRLKMANLIESIQYRYKVDGQEVIKSQSGGTTTTITSFVLAVLLKEIQVIGTSVRIPIIVDEISALDAENTASTIQQISEHGFSIFCATPELTAYLVSEVGRYIHINQNVAKNIIDVECQWNIMPHHVNHWGEHEV